MLPWLLISVVPVLAPSATVQQPTAQVALVPGVHATYQVENGGLALIESESASATQREQQIASKLDNLSRTLKGPSAVPNGFGRAERPVTDGQLGLRFLRVAGTDDTILVIDNGYDRAITYHAVITRGGKSQATDVCLISPHFAGNEHWPYAIDRIEISDVRLVTWKAGDPIPCA